MFTTLTYDILMHILTLLGCTFISQVSLAKGQIISKANFEVFI